MKFFSLLPTVCLTALSGLSGALAAPTTNGTEDATVAVITQIQAITTTSGNLNSLCNTLSITNIFTVGPQIGITLQSIVTSVITTTTQIVQMGPSPAPYPDAIAVQIVSVLTNFVKVHQLLLSTLIGKEGFLVQFPFVAPIRLALVAIEKCVDAFAMALIKLIPTQSAAAGTQITMLKGSLTVAIAKYN
ncbi:hypothetical protein JAAARDRAFT_32470 [Jaapia argillacea MUCL 33604]|uniref:Uncharacterized protein n=1 Tax=Jaapia argillacea MUCL 33604 TaxID=933084 RepID=A0A067Q9A6_9AGAM|nr:hypothetical protein JAAARDRAFT_32470 [Jaapia argillacea MUCL 33604]